MYFSKVIEPQALCDAIAKHLFLRRENIGVVKLAQIDTKETAVVLEDLEGDFPFSVHVHTELAWLNMTEQELAQKLCTTLDAECLIAVDGGTTYDWLLVTPAELKNVSVDPELFDGQCIFKIKVD
jgi:hypothetical protein